MANWVEKPERDFMTIRKTNFWSIIFFLLIGCQPDLSDDPIPYIPFTEIVINLSFPEYASLRTNGCYKEISS